MRKLIGSVVVVCWLGLFSTIAVAQLPPEILADSYLLQVEEAVRKGDHTRAWARIEDIQKLRIEHNLDLPELHFWYAKVADTRNMPQEAHVSIVKYLATEGREGRHYLDALNLLNKLKAAVDCKGWNSEGYFETATLEQVNACLDTGSADLGDKNDSGFAPLHEAVAHTDDPAVVEALLKAGANPLAKDSRGRTPLHLVATRAGSSAIIRAFLNARGDSNKPGQESDPTERYVDILLNAGTDPKNLQQALESIADDLSTEGQNGGRYVETVKVLKKVRAVVSCEGWNSKGYFQAATLEQVTACLDTGGADLEAQNARGYTPLHAAAADSDSPAVIEALTNAGANPLAKDGRGRTPLHLVATRAGSSAIIRAFLNARGDSNKPGQESDPTERYVDILLNAGTDPKNLQQALESIADDLPTEGQDGGRYVETVKVLKKVRAVVSCEGWNSKGYFQAATLEQVTACLDTGGADLEAQNARGYTPLHAAAADSDSPAVIEALMEAGSNLEARVGNLVTKDGRLEPEDTFRSNDAFQDVYNYMGRSGQNMVVEIRSPDFDTYLTVESPSGESFVNDDYQGDAKRSLLSLLLQETGEYRILVSSYSSGKTGSYSLNTTTGNYYTPVHMAAENNKNPAVIKALLAAGADYRAETIDKMTPLHLAAGYNENPVVMEALLAAGGDLKRQLRQHTAKRFTPLHMAAGYNENPAVMEVLLAAGGNLKKQLKQQTTRRYTPLHVAAAYNDNPMVIKILLDAGANLEKKSHDGYRPLHMAAQFNNNPAIAQVLIDAGANLRPSAGYYRNTPLRLAARNNENPAVVQVLIDAGAELNDGTAYTGDTALHYAIAHNKNPAVVQTILDAGASKEVENDNGDRPLHYAGHNENPKVIEALIKASAYVEARNDARATPLHVAARSNNKNPAVIEVLLKAGANPNAKNIESFTPLHFAVGHTENPVVTQLLLKAGADLHARSDGGYTPLHTAAKFTKNPIVVETLLNAGAAMTAESDEQLTPLHRAAQFNENPAVIEVLLNAGANLEALTSSNQSPLHLAAANNELAIIETLLEAGAHVGVRNRWGNTPLHRAAQFNERPAVIEVLLKAGADLAALNENGHTPLYLANEENDNPDVSKVLLAAGAGRVESQMAADRERRKAQSGDGSGWAALVAGVTGAALGAAGGLDAASATELGATIGGSVLAGEAAGSTGQQSIGGSGGGYSSTPTNSQGTSGDFDHALRNLEASCGEKYRSGFSENDHGRFYCLDAFARHCALKNGHNQQQLDALRHDFEALRALGGESRCPYFGVLGGTSATGNEREAVDRAEKEARDARQEEQRRLEEQQAEARQATQERKRTIEENNARVLASDCICISKDEEDGKLTCLDGFVGMTCDIYRPR